MGPFAQLFVLVVVLCCVSAFTDNELHAVSEILDRSCDTHCNNRIKDAKACVLYCAFLDHVKKHDLSDICTLYQEANKDPRPLEWAMDDTVAWKFQTKTDDDHEVAEFFIKSAGQWIKYIKSRKDEL